MQSRPEESARDPEGRAGSVLHLYRELWRHGAGRRRTFLAACSLLVSAQLLLLGIPWASSHAINVLQLHGAAGLAEAGLWLGATVLLGVASWCLHGPGRILERNVALGIRSSINGELVGRLLRLPLAWHERHHSGATVHRVQQSSHALSGFAQSQFIYLNSAVRLVGPVLALWWLEPIVGFAAVAGFAVVTVSVLGFDRAMIRLAHLENDAERRYAATLQDTLGNTTTLFALRQGRSVASLLERRLLAIFEPLKRSIVVNEVKWCTVDLATRILACGLVALFAWRASRGEPGAAGQTLLLGSLYMVWEYAGQAGGVIAAIASHFQSFARQHADYASADVIRRAELSAADAAPLARSGWDRLAVREITFRHPGGRGERPTLDRVAFTLERGKRYALVGSSGSGKSTLLRVLAGLYAGDRVVVDCDGHPTIASPAEAARLLRGSTTLVPQDAEVFEGSLAENLILCEGVDGPPRPQSLVRAVHLARVSEFVEPTAAGLGTPVAERAANWSGGQRARVALARGILAAEGSSLVLLDEPTASLDPRTEAAVYGNLFDAFADACVVSSVHRLNLLQRFDEVLVMHEGRLVAQGPLEVVARSAEFQQLAAAHRHDTEAPAGRPAAA